MRHLGPDMMKGVLKMVTNDSLRKARTEVRRGIQAVYNIRADRINDGSYRKGLSMKFASTHDLTAELRAGHDVISFKSLTGVRTEKKQTGQHFSVATTLRGRKQKTMKGAKVYAGGGVSVKIFKKGSKKIIPSGFVPGMGRQGQSTSKSISGALVFARGIRGKVGFEFKKDRNPIGTFSNISIATAALNTNSKRVYAVAVNEYSKRRLIHHIERHIKKLK